MPRRCSERRCEWGCQWGLRTAEAPPLREPRGPVLGATPPPASEQTAAEAEAAPSRTLPPASAWASAWASAFASALLEVTATLALLLRGSEKGSLSQHSTPGTLSACLQEFSATSLRAWLLTDMRACVGREATKVPIGFVAMVCCFCSYCYYPHRNQVQCCATDVLINITWKFPELLLFLLTVTSHYSSLVSCFEYLLITHHVTRT